MLPITTNSLFSFLVSLVSLFPQTIPTFIDTTTFTISSFSPNDPSLIYHPGDAYSNRAADGRTPKSTAIFSQPVHLWDSTTAAVASFTTTFSFVNAHGLSFFLVRASSDVAITSSADYGHVAVKFSCTNPQSIQVGVVFASSHVVSNETTTIPNGRVNSSVSYDPSSMYLTVLVAGGDDEQVRNFRYFVDLKQVLPEWISVGFSAPTTEPIKVHHWEFRSSLEITEEMRNLRRDLQQSPTMSFKPPLAADETLPSPSPYHFLHPQLPSPEAPSPPVPPPLSPDNLPWPPAASPVNLPVPRTPSPDNLPMYRAPSSTAGPPTPSDTSHSPNDSRKVVIFVTSAVVFVVAVMVAVVGVVVWKKKNKKKEVEEGKKSSGVPPAATQSKETLDEEMGVGVGPKEFTYDDLFRATNGFALDKKLGMGGSGEVYKGKLILTKGSSHSSGMEVAIKRFHCRQSTKESSSRVSYERGKKAYKAEVMTIGLLAHKSLVKLIGWCHERGQLCLVYEYMPNGSLDEHLYRDHDRDDEIGTTGDDVGRKKSLPWKIRYQVALDLASALRYLHNEWGQCVLHRDVKASNVMLDKDFRAKLGDFGLAKLVDHGVSRAMTEFAGTLGYLAPECFHSQTFSKESDVYSFGVVALEIATGRKAIKIDAPRGEKNVVEWAWRCYEEGNLPKAAADPRQVGEDDELDVKEVERLMVVGLWCTHPDAAQRPPINKVVRVLEEEVELPVLPRKVPAYFTSTISAYTPSSTASSSPVGLLSIYTTSSSATSQGTL